MRGAQRVNSLEKEFWTTITAYLLYSDATGDYELNLEDTFSILHTLYTKKGGEDEGIESSA